MIKITPQMRLLLAVEPVDFRKGIDGLGRVFQEIMDSDPFSGYLFVFLNKRKTSKAIIIGEVFMVAAGYQWRRLPSCSP